MDALSIFQNQIPDSLEPLGVEEENEGEGNEQSVWSSEQNEKERLYDRRIYTWIQLFT